MAGEDLLERRGLAAELAQGQPGGGGGAEISSARSASSQRSLAVGVIASRPSASSATAPTPAQPREEPGARLAILGALRR